MDADFLLGGASTAHKGAPGRSLVPLGETDERGWTRGEENVITRFVKRPVLRACELYPGQLSSAQTLIKPGKKLDARR